MKTPFESLGYTKEDKFIVRNNSNALTSSTYEGQVVRLACDDGSSSPYFHSEKGYRGKKLYNHVIELQDLEKIEQPQQENAKVVTVILSGSVEEKRKSILSIIKRKDNGKIFHISNVKKDGEIRKYSAMTGVKADLKGKGSTTDHKPNLFTIFDTTANNYRAVNLDTVIFLSINGEEVMFVDNATADSLANKGLASTVRVLTTVTGTALNVLSSAVV